MSADVFAGHGPALAFTYIVIVWISGLLAVLSANDQSINIPSNPRSMTRGFHSCRARPELDGLV